MTDQTTNTQASNYDPALKQGVKISANNLGDYVANCITSAPTLAAVGGGSASAKTTNTCGLRQANQLYVIAAQTCPNLNTALNPAGVNPGNLAFDDGTVPATTNSCRMYTLLAQITGTPASPTTTLTWVCGYDFPKHRPANVTTDVSLGDSTYAVVGYIYIKNETSSVFTPGTTHLDSVSNLTVTYGDAFGYISYNN
jgi:hypothetical protein